MQKKLNFVKSCREVCNFVERNEYFNHMDSIDRDNYFINEERREVVRLLDRLQLQLEEQLHDGDLTRVRELIAHAVEMGLYRRDKYGINPVLRSLRTAVLFNSLIAPDRTITLVVLLYNLCKNWEVVPRERIDALFGSDVLRLIDGMISVSRLYKKQASVESDHFHKLLISLASDIRVVIIMIVDRLALMRHINGHPDKKFVHDISFESRYLYAPLAHRLGLYLIKSELEDLSLKYLNNKAYCQIVNKISETKEVRERYIENFIPPIREALEKSGLRFEIKGRTKSINSIWNKMKKKDVDLNDVYDLFAIRIIIDTPREQEKRDCWVAYSIVTDIYLPNVSRYRDWISIPKSNGYESLHVTVKGPEDRWVEVQIRTKRMDEVAERGLAAHWRYKGIKGDDEATDKWMNNVREVLEAGAKGPMDLIRDMHINLYDNEVFVFTPRGDLFKLPMGASLLDFAFHVHSKLGSHCIGGRVDGKNQKLGYKLKSGDTVEILTSSTQMPRLDWLNFVVTSKARAKIRQAVNEARVKKADMAREMVQRRFKNRKIDLDEGMMARFITKRGYKSATDFYVDVQDGKIEVGNLVEEYLDYVQRQQEAAIAKTQRGTAEDFVLRSADEERDSGGPGDDILVVGNNVKGVNYKLSRCCNPIYGDDIVGFIASDGAIKVHRRDCGNVRHLIERYPYRIIRSQWSGKMGRQFAATLKVVGRDDIGIVTNITSVINKEGDTMLRNISINSNGGLFEGYLVIGVSSLDTLDLLIKKIKNLKGVKEVRRASH